MEGTMSTKTTPCVFTNEEIDKVLKEMELLSDNDPITGDESPLTVGELRQAIRDRSLLGMEHVRLYYEAHKRIHK